MLLLTETVLFYWDFLDDLCRQSIKDNISGVRKIEDWADKITPAKPVHTLVAQRLRGRGRGQGSRQSSRTPSGATNSRFKSHKGSLASTTSNVRVVSATHSNSGLNPSGSNVASISYIDGLDEDDLQPPPSTQPELSRRKQAMVTVS